MACNGYNHHATCNCAFSGGWKSGRSAGPTGYLGIGSWAPHNLILVSGFRVTWTQSKANFCRPTYCPICNEMVFFVRHNGGSVWFDALGKPWPKHGCFDRDQTVQRALWSLAKSAEGMSDPLYGLVIEAETNPDGSRHRIVIKCEDNKLVTAYISDIQSSSGLVGEIVIVSRKDKKITHHEMLGKSHTDFPNTAYQWTAPVILVQ